MKRPSKQDTRGEHRNRISTMRMEVIVITKRRLLSHRKSSSRESIIKCSETQVALKASKWGIINKRSDEGIVVIR